MDTAGIKSVNTAHAVSQASSEDLILVSLSSSLFQLARQEGHADIQCVCVCVRV